MIFRDDDTIAAPATPAGGALCILRMSGPRSVEICDALFRGRAPLSQAAPSTVHYGIMTDGHGETIDDVLVTVFRAPHSYTGEDAVEISAHGSAYIARRIMRALAEHGARTAEAGEFTRRAFLAGRMDLSQAEAVADVIAADSHASLAVAATQMRGAYSDSLRTLREELLQTASLLELELDFAEEDVQFADRKRLEEQLGRTRDRVASLAASFALGNALKEGVAVAITGRPNAGKSTLLNRLSGEERAMVSDIAGTTRDSIEAAVNIGGVTYHFIDTAGLHDSDDRLERMGMQRTAQAVGKARIILWLVDSDGTAADSAGGYVSNGRDKRWSGSEEGYSSRNDSDGTAADTTHAASPQTLKEAFAAATGIVPSDGQILYKVINKIDLHRKDADGSSDSAEGYASYGEGRGRSGSGGGDSGYGSGDSGHCSGDSGDNGKEQGISNRDEGSDSSRSNGGRSEQHIFGGNHYSDENGTDGSASDCDEGTGRCRNNRNAAFEYGIAKNNRRANDTAVGADDFCCAEHTTDAGDDASDTQGNRPAETTPDIVHLPFAANASNESSSANPQNDSAVTDTANSLAVTHLRNTHAAASMRTTSTAARIQDTVAATDTQIPTTDAEGRSHTHATQTQDTAAEADMGITTSYAGTMPCTRATHTRDIAAATDTGIAASDAPTHPNAQSPHTQHIPAATDTPADIKDEATDTAAAIACIRISAKTGEGIPALIEALRRAVDTSAAYRGDTIVSNQRHYEALCLARESLDAALEALRNGIPSDLLCEDIRLALDHIGRITGEITSDDILQNIFSKFCIGK